MFIEEYLIDLRRGRFGPRAWWHYTRLCCARARATAWEAPEVVRSLGVSALAVIGATLVWALVLSLALAPDMARRYLEWQIAWLAVLVAWQAVHLGLLRDAAGRMPRRIPAATLCTLARLVVLPVLVTLVVARLAWPATVAYVAIALTDVADGWMARRWQQITRLGTVLDMLADQALGVCVCVAMSAIGWAPWYLSALVAARCFLLMAGATYILLCFGPITIRPTVFGKTSGVLGTALTALLLAASALCGPRDAPHVRELTALTLAVLHGANMVQAVLIGVVNLRNARRPRAVPRSAAQRIRPAS